MASLPNDWSTLVAMLNGNATEAHLPVNGAFELTTRCNLACRMCYVRSLDPAAPDRELSASEWVNVAEQAVREGLLFLLLTGGEPLLRTDFFDIYEPLRHLGLHLTLFTNATMVTREVAARLAALPPNRIEVSLYGSSEETCDRVTATPGSFSRCIAGIEQLRSAGLQVSIRTPLSTLNAGEVEQMRRIAASFGAPYSPAWLLTPRRDGCASEYVRLRLSPRAVVDLEELSDSHGTPEAQPGSPSQPDPLFCGAGRTSFVIGPSGRMNVCIDLPEPGALPLVEGFSAAWNRVRDFAGTVELPPACRRCELYPQCPICPAYARLERRDGAAPPPYLCSIAKERSVRTGAGNPCP